ncbi:hypothetical protein C5167_035292 [Papaver somniferum]|uniref:Uncharacterized protein n=1 Tax=Papaver somniferum TaxID=3469 RepID=A0A4Y7KIZ3_PAPSO|nr:hypothetical protein C5167_035292 [Papaver somniferum]
MSYNVHLHQAWISNEIGYSWISILCSHVRPQKISDVFLMVLLTRMRKAKKIVSFVPLFVESPMQGILTGDKGSDNGNHGYEKDELSLYVTVPISAETGYHTKWGRYWREL